MYKNIDLHVHTVNSGDATETVREIIENHDVDIISFTDHDSIGAYSELKEIKVNKPF